MSHVYIHGGVSGVERATLPSLADCLSSGLDAATSLDAVELAVRAMEDDPELNAGWGAVLNRAGELELDAGIVDGHRRRYAGVANVRVRHPVSLARRVLEDTPHVLVAGRGADGLAAELGIEPLRDTTPRQRERWSSAVATGSLHSELYGHHEHVDTVGAVAVDDEGRVAAASSTGGVFGKMPGRVGDSPIFGAGVYASPAIAVVGTGVGELFIETLACLRVAILVERGAAPQPACEEIIDFLGTRQKSAAGLLALDRSGAVGAAFRGGSWAVEGPEGMLGAARVAR